MKTFTEDESISDAQLVELCLSGQREAFGQMVARYQSLICGLAYSGCGDVGRSEDLAQETFLAAWKNLAALKEPGKLKSWLCGITRNLLNKSLRREQRTPTAQADALAPEFCSEGAGPQEQVMSKEEEALVWRTLETIPPGGVAVARDFALGGVAQALEAGSDAARQHIQASLFFQCADRITPYLAWINLLWLLPLFSWRRIIARRAKESAGSM